MSDPVNPDQNTLESNAPNPPETPKSDPKKSEVDPLEAKKLADKAKQLETENANVKAELERYRKAEKEAEEKKLTEQQEWQKIAKNKQEELEQAQKTIDSMKQNEIKNIRRKALMNEIGSVRNEEYLTFANLDMIEVVDGKADPKSVKLVAEDFQRKYPDLIGTSKPKSSSAMAAIPPEEGGDEFGDLTKKENRDKALSSLFAKH